MTNFHELTDTIFYKNMYLSHFILDVSVVCERWVETWTDCYTDPTSSPDHRAAFLPHLGWGCSTGSRWGPQPSVCKLALTLAFLSSTDSTAVGTCLYSFITPNCFRFFFCLFTQVHLLIDGSVKGQYITVDALGMVFESFERRQEELEISGKIEIMQTTAYFRSARILRRVLETWGDLLSLKLQWKTTS